MESNTFVKPSYLLTSLKKFLEGDLENIKADIEKGLGKVKVGGWLRSVRKLKKFSFLVLNDGSCTENLQIVVDQTLENYDEVSQLLVGSSVVIEGELVVSQGKGQALEMQASKVQVIGASDETYPLQKKATSLEHLRDNAHLRARTQTSAAVMRIRHIVSKAIFDFFHERNFYYVNTPILTGHDCEGAGEMFRVRREGEAGAQEEAEPEEFFGQPSYLTVSGQLNAEACALGLGRVFTFGPTFRAENSQTARHLAEFWMVEPEVAFMDLDGLVAMTQDFISSIVKKVLEAAPKDLAFLEEKYEAGLVEKLKNISESTASILTYTEALEILEEAQNSGKVKFEYPVKWGEDLQTEHERYLTEKHLSGPCAVVNYPKIIKPFYMKENEDGKTVRAMDFLVPGVGEIIGGSQRENDLKTLERKMQEGKLHLEDYEWYRQLRVYGSVPHAGFGLGLERIVMYVTGMSNIRDVIPFPRTPQNISF